jgi:hypothetical protein
MRWFFNFASVGREALLDDRFAPEAAIKKQTCGMSAFHPEAKTLHSRR